MSEQSVTDLSVAGQNVSLFELIWQLPNDLVLDFLERASAWEMRNNLAGRLARTVELVRQPIALTPSLRDRSDEIAKRCAEFVLSSNGSLAALVVQLERGGPPALDVEWIGIDNLRSARDGDRPLVVFAPHVGFLYAVPLALAALGERSAVLGSEAARDVLMPVLSALAPRLAERIGYIVVPGPGCARAAAGTLARGDVLVMFPEVNRGATGNVQSATTTFLGRTIWLPTTAARFARIAHADILPALVTPGSARQVRIEFGAPIPAPAGRHADVETSARLFGWLERVIEDRPHLWLGWPMLDSDMNVAADRA